MTALAISPTEIVVTWDIVPPIDQNGVITFYVLFWNFFWPGSSTESQMQTTTSDQMRTLRVLHANVEYLLRVRAFTSVGAGPLSDGVVAQTPEDGKLIMR